MFVVIKFVTEVRAWCILSEMQEGLCKEGEILANELAKIVCTSQSLAEKLRKCKLLHNYLVSWAGCIRHLKLYLEQIFSNTLSQLYKSNVNRKERRGLAFYPVRLNNSSNLTSFTIKTQKQIPFIWLLRLHFVRGPGEYCLRLRVLRARAGNVEARLISQIVNIV